MTESLVTPGKILPVKAGVMISPSILKNTFILPTSSMYFFSTASSQSTCAYPSFSATSWALRLDRSEEHTSELQSRSDLVCRLLLEKKKSDTQKAIGRHHTNHT